MSKRKNPRRAATLLRHFPPESDSNSDDEDAMGIALIQFMQEALLRSRRSPRATKRRRAPKSTNTKRPSISTSRARKNKTPNNTCSTSVATLDSDSNQNENTYSISDDVKESYQKDVENKVNNFFKSNNLLSDDEDEILPKDVPAKPVTASKDFYEIPDSDEDVPSTSGKDVSLELTVVEEAQSSNKDEELMNIVDTILDCDDTPIDVNTSIVESDNWNEFKSKTDEIIGSVTAYLETLKGDEEKSQSTLPVKETSPVKTKPTCPICLEVLEGDTVPGATTCGHIFCMQCIKEVAKTSRKCPTCRKRITAKQIHPLYL